MKHYQLPEGKPLIRPTHGFGFRVSEQEAEEYNADPHMGNGSTCLATWHETTKKSVYVGAAVRYTVGYFETPDAVEVFQPTKPTTKLLKEGDRLGRGLPGLYQFNPKRATAFGAGRAARDKRFHEQGPTNPHETHATGEKRKSRRLPTFREI